MSKDKPIPERGGGVVIAKNITRTRQWLTKEGKVVKEEVTPPKKDKKKTQ